MSSLLVGLAFYVDLPAHLKFTLIALADEANDDGTGIAIGQKRLATKIGHSERSVRSNLAELRDLGYLMRFADPHPQYRTDQYQLITGKLPGQRPGAATVSGQTGSPLPQRKPTSGLPPADIAAGTGSPLPPTKSSKALRGLGSSTAQASSHPNLPSAKKRNRDRLFDAIAVAWMGKSALTRIPSRAGGRIAEARKQLAEIEATPEEVLRFAELWRKAKPGAECSPQAITGNWPTFASGQLERQALGSRGAEMSAEEEERLEALAAQSAARYGNG